MEVEDFPGYVQSIRDCVENVISTPNNDIVNENLVGVTSNEFMEVEDFLEQFHHVEESEKNGIFTVNDEIRTSKTDDVELGTAASNKLMEVEDFLKDVHPIGDSKESVIHTPDDDIHTNKIGNEELVACTNGVFVVAEDFLDDAYPVQDNEQNDKCPSNDEIPTSRCEDPNAVVEKASVQQAAERSVEETDGQPEGTVSSLAKESNDNHFTQTGNGGEYSNPVDEPIKSESSGPSGGICTGSKPDFSKLRGKICLDGLSVKELQETFRAAFGRETSVKDKQWLKRRISMGLSNSCHVLSMNFFVDQGNSVQIVQEESTEAVEDTLGRDLVVEEKNEKFGGLPMVVDNQSEDPDNVSGERLANPCAGHDYSSEDKHSSGIGTKRVRKPTKRYIEELSEVESRENNETSVNVSKNFGHGNNSVSKPCSFRSACDARSVRRPLVTRQDSLGGSGVRVPYVCRIRRSRPRENYGAFMNLQSDSLDLTTKHNKALGSCGPMVDDIEGKVFPDESDSALVQKPIMDELEKERQCPESKTCEPGKDEENVEPGQVDPSGEDSDHETQNMETSKGVKRKHHRPWTLTEVVNLVEGVARFGAGKWSEIKRLSFASHPYRTSVDLKDKWRNLLRASFAQPAAEQGNPRKQVSAPIPPQVLLRVRELAKMHAQVPPVFNSGKSSDGNVHVASPGYL